MQGLEIEKYYEGKRYKLTNKGLRVGDKVFPIARGRTFDDGGWILHELDFKDYSTGFPNDPHTIIDLKYSDYKPYEIKTDKGYGPREQYCKIVKIERQEIKHINPGGILKFTETEWVEEEL